MINEEAEEKLTKIRQKALGLIQELEVEMEEKDKKILAFNSAYEDSRKTISSSLKELREDVSFMTDNNLPIVTHKIILAHKKLQLQKLKFEKKIEEIEKHG